MKIKDRRENCGKMEKLKNKERGEDFVILFE